VYTILATVNKVIAAEEAYPRIIELVQSVTNTRDRIDRKAIQKTPKIIAIVNIKFLIIYFPSTVFI
jgi:hypothetical protein